MICSLSRRNLLSSLAAIPAVVLLAACSDSGEEAKAADVIAACAPRGPAMHQPKLQDAGVDRRIAEVKPCR
jgi:hypothetical protein